MGNTVDAVVAGHACLDIIPTMTVGGNLLAEIFRPGKLINIDKAVVSSGGAVPNTGLALNRLGLSVKLMGKCGNDMFGELLMERIRQQAPGAQTGMRVVDGEITSYTIVISPPGIDRFFMHCSGANNTFGAEDIDLDVVKTARLFHFGYPPLMARIFADDGAELSKIFADVKASGLTTSLDMAYSDPAGPSGKTDWTKILSRTLPNVDLFLPSVEELMFILCRARFDDLLSRAGDGNFLRQINGQILSDLGQMCIEAGVAVIVIKCGYHGIYVRTAGRKRLQQCGLGKPGNLDNWADREIFEPSYKVDKVVSATGSGDNCVAAYLAGFYRGCEIEDALRYATAAGAQNVQAADALSGLKGWEETTLAIKKGWAKNKIEMAMTDWQYDEQNHNCVGPLDRRK